MRRTVVGVSVVLALAGTLVACKSVLSGRRNEWLPPALPAGASAPAGPEIQRARDLYVAKCAKCHRFYPPADYAEVEWNGWMQKMSRKARLNPDEEQLLRRYLNGFRWPEAADTDGATP